MKKILLLGSGGLRIGQAGEFDYSGSQAIKALKEEGLEVILVNSNIATIQTDADMADEVYLQPLNLKSVSKIIEKTKPDAILLSFGGQTALNLGLELYDAGVLTKHKVKVLGSSIETIRLAEDRALFKAELEKIDVKTAKSFATTSVDEAVTAASKVGYPVMMRSAFSLGGLGSGIVFNENELRHKTKAAFSVVPQVLIEENLIGWSEFEYEIVRDNSGNAITVCNMENFDPMGIHTGESIVVSPSQSLDNYEYHYLRKIALQVAEHFKIKGECNIQYAYNLKTQEYRVIEINPRLSRSSALASKATGYPLAFVAAKLALDINLHEIKNSITKKTCAFFEPALDYIVVKIPRWDINKLKGAERRIGTEMKSVGEVMAIGRSFPEALQKAIGMLNIGIADLSSHNFEFNELENEISCATDRRLFALYDFFKQGGTTEKANELSHIDLWFLRHLEHIAKFEIRLSDEVLNNDIVLQAKKLGFTDQSIARLAGMEESSVRALRVEQGITPVVKQIDTLAGEFDAQTNYLYMTYHGCVNDVRPSKRAATIILGSGPYSIGSSVEFDWSGVTMARSLRQIGEKTVFINSNPETVSTDYDESDRLYFEQLSFERVQDIADFENNKGIMVSVGGQVANNLVMPLYEAGYRILGTKPESIDMAENRKKFSSLLHKLGIDQPNWQAADSLEGARKFAIKVGYPVLIRPSFVLSGAAMNVAFNETELLEYLKEAAAISADNPVVISEFILDAKELEVDGVANHGKIEIYAIAEHVENAGVHSGDATIVLPPQRLYLETIRRSKHISKQIVKALNITGPFNLQLIAKDNAIKVIECNVRSSRSFPFVSKVTGYNFIDIATRVIMGCYEKQVYKTLDLDYVGVKSPQFSYSRLKGANPVAHVEMASTGEVACLGDNLQDAFMRSWLATDLQIKGRSLFFSVADHQKMRLLPSIKKLFDKGWKVYATAGTCEFLCQHEVDSICVYKASENAIPSSVSIIKEQEVDLVISLPQHNAVDSGRQITDGFTMRRLAIDHNIPLITNLQAAQLMLLCLANEVDIYNNMKSWQEFTHES